MTCAAGAGVLVLAATPIGDPRDAAAAAARGAGRRRRRRGRGHPAAAPAGPRLGVSPGRVGRRYYERNEAARTAELRRGAGRGAAGAARHRRRDAVACPTPATGWSRPRSRPGVRVTAVPGPVARCSPRWRSPGCRWTGSASRASCRARPASGCARCRRWPPSARTMVFFEAPHRLDATLAAMADGVRGRPAGGGLPRADQDLRGGPPRRAARAGRLGRRGRPRRDHHRGRRRRRAWPPTRTSALRAVQERVAAGERLKDVTADVAAATGLSRKELYNAALAARKA